MQRELSSPCHLRHRVATQSIQYASNVMIYPAKLLNALSFFFPPPSLTLTISALLRKAGLAPAAGSVQLPVSWVELCLGGRPPFPLLN